MKRKKTAGEFSATCKIGTEGNDRELTFTESALFEEHMLQAHGAKPGQCIAQRTRKPDVKVASAKWVSMAFKQLRLGKGNWSPSRLTEDGKAFEPVELEVGATVTWSHGATGLQRSGQVWSVGSRPKSIWVIPFETLPNEAAVMLEQLGSGRLEHRDTARRSTRQVTEPAS